MEPVDGIRVRCRAVLVVATQNPIEHDGTCNCPRPDRPLHDAAVDQLPDAVAEIDIIDSAPAVPGSTSSRPVDRRVRQMARVADVIYIAPRCVGTSSRSTRAARGATAHRREPRGSMRSAAPPVLAAANGRPFGRRRREGSHRSGARLRTAQAGGRVRGHQRHRGHRSRSAPKASSGPEPANAGKIYLGLVDPRSWPASASTAPRSPRSGSPCSSP